MYAYYNYVSTVKSRRDASRINRRLARSTTSVYKRPRPFAMLRLHTAQREPKSKSSHLIPLGNFRLLAPYPLSVISVWNCCIGHCLTRFKEYVYSPFKCSLRSESIFNSLFRKLPQKINLPHSQDNMKIVVKLFF